MLAASALIFNNKVRVQPLLGLSVNSHKDYKTVNFALGDVFSPVTEN